jgi:hypothetical protein
MEGEVPHPLRGGDFVFVALPFEAALCGVSLECSAVQGSGVSKLFALPLSLPAHPRTHSPPHGGALHRFGLPPPASLLLLWRLCVTQHLLVRSAALLSVSHAFLMSFCVDRG